MTAQYAHALLGLGRLDDAERWLDTVVGEVDPESWEWLVVNTMRGRLSSARGQPRAAAAYFLESGRRVVSWGLDNPAVLPWRSLAVPELVSIGQPDHARRLANEELASARRWQTDHSIGVALSALATTASGEESTALGRKAVEHLRRSETVTALLGALVGLAHAETRAGHTDAALALLDEARALAEHCGAAAILEEIAHVRRAAEQA